MFNLLDVVIGIFIMLSTVIISIVVFKLING